MIEAFEDFLQTYKAAPATDVTSVLGAMHIDEDNLSDEYDFMDEEADGAGGDDSRRRSKEPVLKYLELLRKIADRDENEIIIDLDDLAKVCICCCGMGNR